MLRGDRKMVGDVSDLADKWLMQTTRNAKTNGTVLEEQAVDANSGAQQNVARV